MAHKSLQMNLQILAVTLFAGMNLKSLQQVYITAFTAHKNIAHYALER